MDNLIFRFLSHQSSYQHFTIFASRLFHFCCNVLIRLINLFCSGKDVLTRGFCAKLCTVYHDSLSAGLNSTSTLAGNFISSCHSKIQQKNAINFQFEFQTKFHKIYDKNLDIDRTKTHFLLG